MTDRASKRFETINQLDRQMTLALRAMAAELLRTVAGGGRSNEIPALTMNFLEAVWAYHDYTGNQVSAQHMRFMLDPDILPAGSVQEQPDDRCESAFEKEAIARMMERRDAECAIHKGALRQVASMLLNQPTQIANGRRQMLDGIRYLDSTRSGKNPRLVLFDEVGE